MPNPTGNSQYKEKQQENADFFSMAIHELRTPTTVIMGYLSFLLNGKFGELNEKQKDFLEKISKNTQNLLKLINDILDASKLEEEIMNMQKEKTNMMQIILEVTQEMQILCEEKHIELKTNIIETEIWCNIDQNRIKQVLVNLISNAQKFTPQNGMITITSCKKGKKGVFSVHDTGAGIPKNEKEKIFEKFYQGKKSEDIHTPKGTGLGLPIVKSILKKHDGEIWFESEEGEGATFYFSLPLFISSHDKKK